MIYNLVGCGGTFDHLHDGHKAFLRFAFSHGKKVLIGLTSDAYINHYKATEDIASFAERRALLEVFLQTEGYITRAEVVPIDTSFGPAINGTSHIEAIIVTEETVVGARQINGKRKDLGMPELPVVVMPLIKKNGKRISSSAIRAGIMDEEGNAIKERDFSKELLLLPESLRESLQIPFGKLFKTVELFQGIVDCKKSVVVGDATTVVFHQNNMFPVLSIIDFVIQRERKYKNLKDEGFQGREKRMSVLNPSGTITPELWQVIRTCVDQFSQDNSFIISVEGEEDLAVLPLVLELPVGFYIYYGQPAEGIVQVVVNSETKERVKRLLQQFNRA